MGDENDLLVALTDSNTVMFALGDVVEAGRVHGTHQIIADAIVGVVHLPITIDHEMTIIMISRDVFGTTRMIDTVDDADGTSAADLAHDVDAELLHLRRHHHHHSNPLQLREELEL